ncbi:hypothetical protein BS50DRAFT_411196 [Corynespora cassiicola Philippines]|uniref:Uncharacterized protein n=1 Tax=Corynespora cassiicola Philippines TaxID=1448308 RepID=A0A2T2NLH8_CORCC|nr:hypothetical protein BS50DRAFT_411196 [Corynespora cassiicola Philippines]
MEGVSGGIRKNPECPSIMSSKGRYVTEGRHKATGLKGAGCGSVISHLVTMRSGMPCEARPFSSVDTGTSRELSQHDNSTARAHRFRHCNRPKNIRYQARHAEESPGQRELGAPAAEAGHQGGIKRQGEERKLGARLARIVATGHGDTLGQRSVWLIHRRGRVCQCPVCMRHDPGLKLKP